MTTILDRAGVILFGDDSELQASLNRAQSSMQSAGKNMQRTGRTLSTRVTLPLAAMGAASVKAFSDFDGAMNQSLAIMGDVSETMRTDMEAAARSVSRTTTVSATEAADAYFFLASAGLDAEQSIAALPQVAAFAQAGMFDMSTATDLATDAQSALGMAAEDAQENLTNLARVTDVLVGANTLANATVEQFSTALTTEAGAAMKTFNQDMEEGVAVLAAFADQGIKGQRAGSGYSRILRLMSQAAVNNKEEMQELGISFFDAQGNMRNMADVVENLTTVLGPMSDEQRAAALESIGFTARVQGIIQPLLGTSDAIREYEAALREAGGTTVEVSENQMQSFSAQMTVAKNNVQNAAIIIGDVLGPTLIKVGEALGAAARRFEEMDEATQKNIVAAAALVAAGGPLLIILGTLVSSIGSLIGVVRTAITLAPALAGGITTVGRALSTLFLNPVGLAIAALAALVLAGKAVVDNWDVIKFEAQQVASRVRGMVDALWEELIGRFGRLVDGVREKVDQVAGFFRDLRDRVVGNSYIPEMIDGIAIEFERLDAVMVAPVKEATSRAGEAIKRMGERVADQGVDAFVDFAMGSGDAIENFVKRAMKDLARLIARLIFVRTLSSFFPGVGGLLGGIVGRQHGGPVQANRPFLVGERGPELFVPAAAGNIVANDALGGGAGGMSLTLHVPPARDPISLVRDNQWRAAFSEMVADAKERGLRFEVD